MTVALCLWSAVNRLKCSTVSKCVAGIRPSYVKFVLFSSSPRFCTRCAAPGLGALLANAFWFQQSTNNKQLKKAKEFGLNILNTLRSLLNGISLSGCICLSRLRAVLAASFPPVCLLIEILIEISEGDFNHRGVVHAYLSEPQRKKEYPADAVTPLIQQPLSGRNVP